jgi:hypothetical protein
MVLVDGAKQHLAAHYSPMRAKGRLPQLLLCCALRSVRVPSHWLLLLLLLCCSGWCMAWQTRMSRCGSALTRVVPRLGHLARVAYR